MDRFLHYFTPHHTNNHRPRILHPTLMIYYAIFFLILQFAFRIIHQNKPYILGIATDIRVNELYKYTNEERTKKGLAPLTINPLLSKAAEKKAKDMFARNYWAHEAPNGTTPWDFIVKENYKYVYAGENLARDFSYSKDVIGAWMNSTTHRENILRSEYKEIGFAVVNGNLNAEETTLVVQMFGTPQVAVKPAIAAEQQLAVPAGSTSVASGISLGVMNVPAFDQFTSMRIVSLLTIGGLLGVLAIDGLVILKRRTVRIAGHNMAHFIFLVSIAGILLLTTSGGIM